MSANDRTILLVIPLIAGVLAFWLLALSPNQDKVSKLDKQASELRASVAEQQQAAQEGRQARAQFPRDYHRIVVMGKAVPVDDETASLLVELNRIAASSGADFRAITMSDASGSSSAASTAAAPPSATTSSSDNSSSSSDTSGSSTATSTTPSSSTATSTTAAPPTESAAAELPIGASVGSAGLATLPYELTFRGTYSEIAAFMAGVDRLVDPRRGTIAADGRLVTIDGFSLTADEAFPYPVLKATLQVMTYVTPPGQSLTAGATPTGPSGLAATSTATPTTP